MAFSISHEKHGYIPTLTTRASSEVKLCLERHVSNSQYKRSKPGLQQLCRATFRPRIVDPTSSYPACPTTTTRRVTHLLPADSHPGSNPNRPPRLGTGSSEPHLSPCMQALGLSRTRSLSPSSGLFSSRHFKRSVNSLRNGFCSTTGVAR